MPKARRRKIKPRRQTPSTGLVLAVIGLAVVLVVALIALTGGAKKAQVPTASGQVFETSLTAEGFPYKGAADAPVTIVVYSDYQCPHCRDFALETEPLLDQAYVATGKVKRVAPYFALWPESQPFVAAAICAAEQGKFWEFDHLLFVNQETLQTARLPTWAQQVGLDVNAFNRCRQSNATLQKVQSFTQQANAAGIHSTPIFFINGNRFELKAQPSFFEQLREEIERLLTGTS